MSEQQMNEEVVSVINIRRVAKTTKGGRKMSFSALVVYGDGKNRIGYGTGKGASVISAVEKAERGARNNCIDIATFRNSICHQVEATVGSTKVLLMPASPGTGIKCGSAMRKVVQATQISDVFAKITGSRNAMNVIRATFAALKKQRTLNEVAESRGLKLADMCGVYEV